MTKPSFTPNFSWVANAAGQMTGEAQRLLRKLIDITWNRTGLETSKVVTGTAGTNGNISKWNAAGDLVDGGKVAANLLSTTDIGVTVQGYDADLLDLASRWTAASASGPATLDFREDADNGTNLIRITVPAALASDYSFVLPAANVAIDAFAANFLDDANAAAVQATLGVPPNARTISAGGIATGGGDLSANRTITVTAATAADQETGTSTTVAVVPGVQHRHPSAAKAWCFWTVTGSISASYNITSITDNAAGNWTVNIATDFSSANYAGFGFGGFVSGVSAVFYATAGIAAGTFSIIAFNTAGTPVDPTTADPSFVAFGDQ